MSSTQVRQKDNAHKNSRIFSAFSQSLVGWELVEDTLRVVESSSEPERPGRRRPLQTEMLEVLEEAQGLTRASQALLALAASTSVRGLHRVGIATLPNEVLLEIFDKMLPDLGEYPVTEASAMVQSISLVCRRFRKTLLAFPKVWGYMNLGWLGEDDLQRHLARSKHMPLYIEFDYTDTMEPVLLQALEHKDCWVYLDCSFGSEDDWSILHSHPSSVFPSLRTLRIFADNNIGGTRCDRLYFGWRFARVEDLEVRQHIPASGIFDHSSLTTLKYMSLQNFDGTFLTSLTGFLEPASSLRTLHLDVSDVMRVRRLDGELRRIVLPSVIDFTVTSLNSRYYGGRNRNRYDGRDRLPALEYACILHALCMPKVQKISVSMLNPYDAQFNVYEWLVAAFHPSSELGHLTSFEFHLRWWLVQEGSDPCCIPIYDFVRFFPQLRDLAVNAEDCHYTFISDASVRLSRLRSLRLKSWESDQHVVDVFRTMKCDGADPTEIQIHSKGVVNGWESLRSIFPSATIKVIEKYQPCREP